MRALMTRKSCAVGVRNAILGNYLKAGKNGKNGTVPSRAFRSGMASVDWSKCLICKDKTYKKSRDLTNVCTFEVCQSIQLAAERKGDSSMLHKLNGVNGDLIAMEAKYHKNCFAT